MFSRRPYLIASMGFLLLSVLVPPQAQPTFGGAGSQAAPGGNVAVPLTMMAGGLEICAISADVVFDPGALTFNGGQAGPAGTSAGKNAVVQPMGPGHIRLALIGMNRNPIPDGSIFLLQFTVNQNAASTALIRVTCGAADCNGADHPPFQSSIAIGVIGGEPEPPESTPQSEPSDPSGTTDPADPVDTDSPPEPSDETSSRTTDGTASSQAGSTSEGSTSAPVEREPKELSATFSSAKPGKGIAPLKVALRISVEGGAPPYTMTWDFDDGSEVPEEASAKRRVLHLYELPGLYEPEVKVEDSEGAFLHLEGSAINVAAPEPPAIRKAIHRMEGEDIQIDIHGNRFLEGCTVSVNGMIYMPDRQDDEHLIIKGVTLKDISSIKVKVLNPTDQVSKIVETVESMPLEGKGNG